MRFRLFIPILGLLLLLSLGGYATLQRGEAQTDPNTICSPLINTALTTVGQSCGGQGRNTACYGYTRVLPEFLTTAQSSSFEQPADLVSLSDLEKLSTTPLNASLNEWGIAVLNVQANLPDTLPGQSAIFLLLGDTEIENAVSENDVFVGGGPIELTAQLGANLYVRPTAATDISATVPSGAVLLADAISADGEWLRVAYIPASISGWVARINVTAPDTVNTLPVYDPQTSAAPMQAFYLRTNIGGLECEQAPNTLVIQGPRNALVEFTANGADIRIGSTVVLRTIPFSEALLTDLRRLYGASVPRVSAFLQIFVIDGEAVIYPDTDDEVIVKAGETSYTCLSNTQNLGTDGERNDRRVIDGCGWFTPRGYTVDEIDELYALDELELNYPIDVNPDFPPPVFPTNTPQDPPTPAGTPTNTPTPTLTFTPTNTFTATNTFTPTFTFTPTPSDLELVAAVNPERVVQGTMTTFGYTIVNNGLGVSNDIVASDLLPVGFTALGVPSVGTYDSANDLWTIPTLGLGQNATLLLSVTAPNTLAQTYTTTATVTSATTDPNLINNTKTVSFTVQSADLSVTKAATNLTPTVGIAFDYNITVTNVGPDTATSVVIADQLPAFITYVSDIAGQGDYDPLTGEWAVGDLAMGATVTLHITVMANQGGTITNTAQLQPSSPGDPNSANDSDSVDVIVQPVGGCPLPATAFDVAQLINYINAANNETLCPGPNTITLNNTPSGYPITSVYADLTGLPIVTSNITIQGNSALINGGDAGFRIFKIVSPGLLDLYSVNVTNGSITGENGGAIYNAGNLGLRFSTVTSSSSTTGGGGIYNVGLVSISDSLIEGNTAPIGGGILNDGSATLFSLSNVSYNTATASGGGGIESTNAASRLFIYDSTISNNSSFEAGGGVEAGGLEVVIYGSTFEQNTARNGGGLYLCSASNQFESNLITQNSAINLGGGLYICGTGSSTIESSTIVNNNAANGAGATILSGNHVIRNSEISLNDASLNGGGLAFLMGEAQPVDIVNVTISGNTAAGIGSAVYAFDGAAHFSFVTIWNNGDASGTEVFRIDGGAFAVKNTVIGSDTANVSSCSGVVSFTGLGENYTNDTATTCDNFNSRATVAYQSLILSGLTRTHAPQASNPAIDAVTDCTTIAGVTVTIDQRNIPRPDGIRCDAGGYETREDADVAVTKVVDNYAPFAGDSITFTLTATNNGPNVVYALTITDFLPFGLNYTSSTASAGSYDVMTGDWTLSTPIAVNASETLQITVLVDASVTGTTVNNTATSTASRPYDGNFGNNQQGIAIDVQPDADLDLQIVVDNATPFESDVITFMLTVTNNSPYDILDLTVQDDLPVGLSFVGATAVGAYNRVGNGIAQWEFPFVNGNGGSQTLEVQAVVDVGAAGMTFDYAGVLLDSTPSDPSPPSSSQSVTVQITADMLLTSDVTIVSAGVGTNVVVNYSVTNLSSTTPSLSVVVNDLDPVGLTGVASPPPQGTYSSGLGGVWDVGTVAPSTTLTLTVTYNVLPAQLSYSTTAFITASTVDLNSANNSWAITINVNDADLAVTVTAVPDETTPRGFDDIVQYTVTITNNGPNPVFGATVATVLPTETIELAPPVVSEGSFGSGSWTGINLAPGESATLVWDAKVNTCFFSSLDYSASLSSPVDAITSNNADSISHPFASIC